MGAYEDALFAETAGYSNHLGSGNVSQIDVDSAIYNGSNMLDQLSLADEKKIRLDKRYLEKQRKLREDPKDYGHDGIIVSAAKGLWNSFASHDNQAAVNYEGKRYNTQNKIFNNSGSDELKALWDSYEDNPEGDKSLYYLRKADGVNDDGTTRYQYKTGIADVSAADRYRGQLKDSGYDIVSEKRFDEASTFEKKFHGSQAARDARSYDYGQYRNDKHTADQDGVAYSDFGAGTSELYNKDILGLDTGTAEDYALNRAKSKYAMDQADAVPYQRNDTFESIDALQAGAVTLAGKGVKLFGQGLSNILDDDDVTGDGVIESYGKQLMEDANKITGYNPKTMVNATKDMAQGWREGNPMQFLSGLISAAPQAVAGSIPESAMYFGSGGVGLAGRLGGLALANANDQLDQREVANGGRKATDGERAAVMFAETFATALDAGSLRFITKGLPGLGLTNKGGTPIDFAFAMKNMPKSTKIEVIKSLSRGLGRSGGAFATEAAQETTTEAIRMLNETLGTDKYGDDALAIMMSPEGSHRLRDSLLLGGAGGIGFNAPRNINKTVGEVRNNLKVGKSLKTGEIAGQNAQDTEDAEAKKMYAESRLVDAEESIGSINSAMSSVDKAKTVSDVILALKETVGKNGLIGPSIAGTIKGLQGLKDTDIDLAQENAHEALRTTGRDIITDAQANTKALDGLNSSIESGDRGEQLNKGLDEINSFQSDLSDATKEQESAEAKSNQADAKYESSKELELNKYELQRYKDKLADAQGGKQSIIDDINKDISRLEKLIESGSKEAISSSQAEVEKESANKKLEESNSNLDSKTKNLLDAVRKSKSPELEEAYAEIELMKKNSIELENKIADSQGKKDADGLRKKLAADRKRIEAASRKLLAVAEEKAKKYVEPEAVMKPPSDRAQRKKKKSPTPVQTKTSIKEQKKAKIAFDKKQKDLESREAELEAEKNKNKSELKETKKEIREAKKADLEETKTDRSNLKINEDLAKSKQSDIDKIESETDIDAAKGYDPVGDQVSETKSEAEKIGKDIDPKRKKRTIVSKIFRSIFSVVPGIDGNKVEATKTGFSNKLAKISTAALTKLNDSDSINELDEMLTGKNGFKPFSKQDIKDAIEKEMRNRNISDKFFAKGAEISGNESKYKNPLEVSNALESAKESRSILEEEDNGLTKEQEIEIGNEYIISVNEVLGSLHNMDIIQFRNFSESGALREAMNDVLGWLGTTGNENADKQIKESIRSLNAKSDSSLSNESRKRFLFKISRSAITEDANAIKAAKEDIEVLLKEGIFTESQAETMRNALTDVKERSAENNIAYQEAVSVSEQQTEAQIDEKIENNTDMSDKDKETMLNWPIHMKIQLMNTFGAIDNRALEHLQGLGIQYDSVVFEDGESTITIKIGEGC